MIRLIIMITISIFCIGCSLIDAGNAKNITAPSETTETIDEKAEKILSDAKAKTESIASEATEKLAEATEKRFAEIKALSDEQIMQAEKLAEEKCRILDEKMDAGREKWKKEITERIIDPEE